MSRRVSLRPGARRALVASAFIACTAGLVGTIAAVVSASACTDTTTINAALASGIFINQELLLGELGCSNTSNLDVYKYLAVAINDTKGIAGAGIFDCFAPGVFANLPGTDGGALSFAIWIYAYNPADFAAANQDNALTNAVAYLNGVNQPDGSVVPVGTNIVPDGGTTTKGYPAALSTICLRKATWISTCTASAQDTVQTLANCVPLYLEDATPSSCNLPIVLPEAGVAAGH